MPIEKQFNTAGPCKPDKHYQIDPLDRIDYLSVLELIRDERYFVLHAPRQTGKTTSLIALVHHLNATGQYRAVYANIEGAQAARHDVALGMTTVVEVLLRQIERFTGETALCHWLEQHRLHSPTDMLVSLLTQWSRLNPRPAVLILDEVDALVGDTLVSLLRQLRSGYADRPARFPQSVILCGVRDIRDYRIHTQNQEIITGGSAFNIKAESRRMSNFTAEECQTLWSQHTQATGQVFDAAIFPKLWEDTRGQPWLVNALGQELAHENPSIHQDRTRPITLEDYRTARENLIQRRDTHLDQLIDKLREPRVQAVIGPLLVAEDSVRLDIQPDDQRYVEDLGLIRTRPEVTIANRIYAEVIPRELTWIAQTRITQQQAWFLRTDRSLDMPKLLAAFQQFFREHSESWLEHFDYKEAGPQLLLQAFLQRIVNGGGRIDREYGLGRKRTDLYIQWPLNEQQGYHGPVQRIVLELKLWRKGTLEKVLETGLPQTADYTRQCGAAEAHLLIFDRRPESDWDQRIWQATHHQDGYAVQVWGVE
jgi:hypothetical protein